MIWNLVIQKGMWQPQKKNDIKAWLNQLPNIHILRRNPTSRWVDFKTTHQLDGCTQNLHMRPLTWGNKKREIKKCTLNTHTPYMCASPIDGIWFVVIENLAMKEIANYLLCRVNMPMIKHIVSSPLSHSMCLLSSYSQKIKCSQVESTLVEV